MKHALLLLAAAGCTAAAGDRTTPPGGAAGAAGSSDPRPTGSTAAAGSSEGTTPRRAAAAGSAVLPEEMPPQPGKDLYARGEHYDVRLALDPAAPAVGQLFRVIARVRERDSGEAPPEDARVHLDATMPDHRHGMLTRTEQRALGGGRFLAEGFRFHMPGAWRFEVEVEAQGIREVVHLPWEQAPIWER